MFVCLLVLIIYELQNFMTNKDDSLSIAVNLLKSQCICLGLQQSWAYQASLPPGFV